jgi:Alw26I/Eco31I/Esp3I family type II restriction m6 adenine DNA methyltransferase
MEKPPSGVNNQSLFTDYYLTDLVKDDDLFKKSHNEFKAIFEKIKEAYEREKKFLKDGLKENETERRFIRPVLDILGHIYALTPNVYSPEGTKQPDFAFFATKEDHEEAEKKFRDKNEYFTKAISIADAKRWNRSLDKKIKESVDPFTNQNPSYQIDFYLRATDKKWGILTNGRHWRLYNRDTSYRLDVFYEIDLPTILEAGDYEAFLYFYAFFKKEAFTEGFLERAYKESIEYTSRLGDELKENVYEALRLLAEGFLHFPGNNLTQKDLDPIRENTFVLIYRILFILYAEDRGLLPLDKPEYQSYSLRNLAKDIAGKLDQSAHLSPTAQVYWAKIQELFRMINEGDDYTNVPPYNGGLFDSEKHQFLTIYKLGDFYIAKAIDQITRAETSGKTGRGSLKTLPLDSYPRSRGFVSYRDMEIRHIGSIYEGLLEHNLKVAPEDLAVVKDDKGKEIFVSKTSVKNKKIIETYHKGEVFLETDRGERRATGSYYTPDYIVKYIVSNTLGPLLADRKKVLSERAESLKERLKNRALGGAQKNTYKDELQQIESGNAYLEEILKTKVLDPATGSGHFLVEATDFLARELVKTLGETPEELTEDDIRWARREVVERCIFGVDLNPLAVELAKLSLWLYTVARNRPLSFLDHHLRCGNSLIGAWIKDLGNLPVLSKKKAKTGDENRFPLFDESQFTKDVSLLMGDYKSIENLPSVTVEQIKEKDRILRELINTRRERYIKQADISTSVFFGNEINGNIYRDLVRHINGDETQLTKKQVEFYLKKAEDLTKEKRFFHWELEFPEVFFEGHRRKDNPGFDVVIGNPPYDVISEKEQEREVEAEKEFFTRNPLYYAAIGSKLNFYRLFTALSLGLLCDNGIHGFIVPMALLGDEQARPLREYLLKKNSLKLIEAFPQKDNPQNRVFQDAKLSTCVYIIKKSSPISFMLRVHPGKYILDTSPIMEIDNKQIEVLDPENLSIPSYPGMTANDFKIALKLVRVSKGAKLGDLAPSQQGEVNLTTHAQFLSDEPKGQVVLRGTHVGRYEFQQEPKQGSPKYLDVKRFLKSHGLGTKAHDYNYIRIGYQRGSAIYNWRRIITTIIEPGNFCSDTINYIVNPKEINLFAILALLNSSLWEWRFRLTSTNNHVNSYEIDGMPMIHFNFITPESERKKQLEKGKMLYERCLKKGDDMCVTGFVEHHLYAKPERSDVVHDLLAFLAEQMIEMSKKRQKEIKGFLTWLEGYVGTKIDDLTNKTDIRSYYELFREDLFEILEQNRRKIDKVDITRREPQEKIKKEFEDSLSKLRPLLSRIQATDKLIDQIVYKLYGLTEEEIQVIEKVGKS